MARLCPPRESMGKRLFIASLSFSGMPLYPAADCWRAHPGCWGSHSTAPPGVSQAPLFPLGVCLEGGLPPPRPRRGHWRAPRLLRCVKTSRLSGLALRRGNVKGDAPRREGVSLGLVLGSVRARVGPGTVPPPFPGMYSSLGGRNRGGLRPAVGGRAPVPHRHPSCTHRALPGERGRRKACGWARPPLYPFPAALCWPSVWGKAPDEPPSPSRLRPAPRRVDSSANPRRNVLACPCVWVLITVN